MATFREKDAASLAAKMLELAESPALVEKLAAITRANAEKFAMQNVFARHVEIYREVQPRS